MRNDLDVGLDWKSHEERSLPGLERRVTDCGRWVPERSGGWTESGFRGGPDTEIQSGLEGLLHRITRGWRRGKTSLMTTPAPNRRDREQSTTLPSTYKILWTVEYNGKKKTEEVKRVERISSLGPRVLT